MRGRKASLVRMVAIYCFKSDRDMPKHFLWDLTRKHTYHFVGPWILSYNSRTWSLSEKIRITQNRTTWHNTINNVKITVPKVNIVDILIIKQYNTNYRQKWLIKLLSLLNFKILWESKTSYLKDTCVPIWHLQFKWLSICTPKNFVSGTSLTVVYYVQLPTVNEGNVKEKI